jgi:hypothetical protein
MESTPTGTSFENKIILPATQIEIPVVVPPSLPRGRYNILTNPAFVKVNPNIGVKPAQFDNMNQVVINVSVRNHSMRPFELFEGTAIVKFNLENLCDPTIIAVENLKPNELQDSPLKTSATSNETSNLLFDGIEANSNLTTEEKSLAKELITKHNNIFVSDPDDLKCCNLYKVKIVLSDPKPIAKSNYKMTNENRDKVMEHVAKLKRAGTIVDSCSPYNSPCLLVAKGHQGDTRLVINYKAINEVMRTDNYPIPHIEDILNKLHGSKWFT